MRVWGVNKLVIIYKLVIISYSVYWLVCRWMSWLVEI